MNHYDRKRKADIAAVDRVARMIEKRLGGSRPWWVRGSVEYLVAAWLREKRRDLKAEHLKAKRAAKKAGKPWRGE